MMSRRADLSPSRRLASGFTLIEVLAALVIVALGMLGVIQAVTQTARNGTYLREKTLAHWIGMNLITERRLLASPPDVAESSDELEFAGQRWRWTLRVTQTPVASLRRMDVSVRAAGAPETSSLATVTGFYGTAIGASGGGVVAWGGEADGGGPGGDGDQDPDGDDGNPDDGKPGPPGSSDEPPPDAGDPGTEVSPSTD